MELGTKPHYLLLVLFFAIYLLCGEIGSLISILVGLAPLTKFALLETESHLSGNGGYLVETDSLSKHNRTGRTSRYVSYLRGSLVPAHLN